MAIAVASTSSLGKSSFTADLTITKPSGVSNGDILFAHIDNNISTAPTGPSGWERLDWVSYNGGSASIWLKKITNAAGEPASYTWTFAASRAAGGILRITGANSTAKVMKPIPTVVSATTGTPDPPASGTVPEGDYLIIATTSSQSGDATYTPPENYTEQVDVNTGSDGIAQMSMSMATRVMTGITSENPGTFTRSQADDPTRTWTVLIPGIPTVSGSTLAINANLNDNVTGDSSHTNVRYKVDAGSWNTMSWSTDKWTANLDTTTLSNGTHTITVEGTDGNSNVGDNTFDIDVQNVGPVINVTIQS